MRNTLQQSLILDIVMASCTHPSAEDVYESARKVIPKISLGTVYRVLNGLAENGKIIRIPQEDGDRYDKTTCVHSHFRCSVCGRFFDIDAGISEDSIKLLSEASGNHIVRCDAIFSGICAECKNKSK